MKIAIVGYGKMGREIESIAKDRGHIIVTIDTNASADYSEINEISLKGTDVAIDFTVPEAVLKNCKLYNKYRVNTVMGTTGWYDNNSMEEVRKSVKGIGFLWSANFSIGVNLFFRIIENASKIINNISAYDVSGYEIHHKGKKDSPSGTAKILTDILLKNIKRKNKVVFDRLDRKIKEDELHFASLRCGAIAGTHSIIFDSEADTIELKHLARGRSGFAAGAVMAAEWLKGKKGFYNIDDFMKELIK